VTNEWDMVTVSANQGYTVANQACATAGVYTLGNGEITTVGAPTTVYYAQPLPTYYVAPYNQIGPLAIPGYAGSGLCTECLLDGVTQQAVYVKECVNGVCFEYEETWQGIVTAETSVTNVPYNFEHPAPTNGVYAFPEVDITINISNAPTTISVHTTMPSTVTKTRTSTSTSTGSLTRTVEETATATSTVDDTLIVPIVIAVAQAGNQKRAVSPYSGFIGFVNGVATVVHGHSHATRFTLSEGFLMAGEQFVGASSTDLANGNGAFNLFTTKPEIATTWTAILDGGIFFSSPDFSFGDGDAVFCGTSSGALFVEYSSAPDFGCLTLALTALAANDTVPIATSTTESTPFITDVPEPTSFLPTTTDASPLTTDSIPNVSFPTSTVSSASSDPSADPSADATNIPAPTPTALRKRSFRDSKMVRRGGLFRSPLKKAKRS